MGKVEKTKRQSSVYQNVLSEAATQRCSKNMPQIYGRTPMPKCDFNKVGKQLY